MNAEKQRPRVTGRTRKIREALAELQRWCESVSEERRDEKLGRLHERLMSNRTSGTKRG